MPSAVAHRKRSAVPKAAFHGVSCPTTHEVTDSDLHRAYLTRLCCAYRLSQPLGAFFHPRPCPPCFVRVTPVGFGFQRFSLPGSEERLTTTLPLVPFLARRVEPANRIHCQRRRGSRDSRIREVRIDRLSVTRGVPTDPLLALPLFEVFTPPALVSCFHEASSHGLLRLAGRRTVHLDGGSAEFQRTEG